MALGPLAELAAPLAATAQSAFMGGMQLAAYAVAAILAGVGVLVLIHLRHLPPLDEAQSGHPEPASAATA